MSNQEEKRKIENVLAAYAQVLNAAKTEAIAGFYTKDGILLPEGVTANLKPAQLITPGASFFSKNEFSISYTVQAVFVEGFYAFVEAKATTTQKELKSGTTTGKTSKDFFVFRQEDGAWKIYRYMFSTIA